MRALVLMSGGIDSRLASALLERHAVALHWLHFETGTSPASSRERLDRWAGDPGAPPLTRVDVRREYLDRVVRRPRHGTPFAHAPCIDCRIFMLGQARQWAARLNCAGLATGDVLGQGGPGQSRESLERIDREADVEGWVLRPLSSAYLPYPELWPAGELPQALESLSIHGRGRGPIAAMARQLGVEPEPLTKGGCCLLADPGFRRRLRDALEHPSPTDGFPPLLEIGRHFRLSWNAKCIVARNAVDGAALEQHDGPGWLGCPVEGSGAAVKLTGEPDSDDLRLAATLCLRFSPASAGGRVRMRPVGLEAEARSLIFEGLNRAGDEDLALWRI